MLAGWCELDRGPAVSFHGYDQPVALFILPLLNEQLKAHVEQKINVINRKLCECSCILPTYSDMKICIS